jgi:Tol biopolymer transport system component
METGALRVLKHIPRPGPGPRVQPSPDGGFIAYDYPSSATATERDIFLVPGTGGAETRLLDGPSNDRVVGWSSDGESLAFVSGRLGARELWMIRVRAGAPVGEPVLIKSPFTGDPLGMTDQGDVFYEEPPTGPPATVMAARFDPATGAVLGVPTPLAADRLATTSFPRWSPDGTAYMHVTSRPTGRAISVVAVATGAARDIPLPELGYLWTLDWAPDGRSLVLRANSASGRSGVFQLDLQSGDVRTIVFQVPLEASNPVGFYHPEFAPDGRAVRYYKVEGRPPNRTWSYNERDLQSGVERVLFGNLGDLMAGADPKPVGGSPDGRFLMAVVHGPLEALRAYDTTTGLTRNVLEIPTTGAEVFNHDGDLRWLPDSRSIIGTVRTSTGTELWWIPLDDRRPHRIEIGSLRLTTHAVAVHPSGAQIAFVVNPREPEDLHEFRLLSTR